MWDLWAIVGRMLHETKLNAIPRCPPNTPSEREHWFRKLTKSSNYHLFPNI